MQIKCSSARKKQCVCVLALDIYQKYDTRKTLQALTQALYICVCMYGSLYSYVINSVQARTFFSNYRRSLYPRINVRHVHNTMT